MIRLTDATKLAATKLRTRKVRLVVTIVIAGLMFSVLAAASQISRGAFDSLAAFGREGFGERYITVAMPNYSGGLATELPEVVDRAVAIQKNLVAQKTAEAKKLGIEYDSKSEPAVFSEFDGPTGKVRMINLEVPAGQQAAQEYYKKHPQPGLAELKKQAGRYNPQAYYESKGLALGPGATGLQVLKQGKEDYSTFQKSPDNPYEQRGLSSFATSWGLMSQDLLQPFLLPGASTALGNDGSVPVIAPYSAVEEIQGLKALPSTSKPAQRLDRLKQVRAQAADLKFEACYRNPASQQLLQTALNQQKELADNKGKKDYVAPELLYGLPKTACGPVVIQTDKRSAADKVLAGKQDSFDRKFGLAEEPRQQTVSFRVIGISPDPPDFSASVVSSLVSSIVSSNLSMFGPAWLTPLELEAKQPVVQAAFTDDKSLMAAVGPGGQYSYAEFDSAQTARTFMEQETCQPEFGPTGPAPGEDIFAACTKAGKYFSYMPFGSNALALDGVKQGFSRIFGYVAVAVAVVAAIIMVGTVGRTIADSRRETAVFRAIGAKKIDIVTVYLIYTFFLSMMIFLFALIAGFAIAQLAHAQLSPELTVQALVAYNANDLTKTFDLYSFYIPDMAQLIGLSLAGGALSAFFPLLRNLRRNPIRDMRDEN